MKLTYGEKAAVRILNDPRASLQRRRMVRDTLRDRGGHAYLTRIEAVADRHLLLTAASGERLTTGRVGVSDMAWVVVGFDRFSYEHYPVAIERDRDRALAVAEDRARRPNGSPGLADTYSVEPMDRAMRLTDLLQEQIEALTRVLAS